MNRINMKLVGVAVILSWMYWMTGGNVLAILALAILLDRMTKAAK